MHWILLIPGGCSDNAALRSSSWRWLLSAWLQTCFLISTTDLWLFCTVCIRQMCNSGLAAVQSEEVGHVFLLLRVTLLNMAAYSAKTLRCCWALNLWQLSCRSQLCPLSSCCPVLRQTLHFLSKLVQKLLSFFLIEAFSHFSPVCTSTTPSWRHSFRPCSILKTLLFHELNCPVDIMVIQGLHLD